MLKKLIRPLLPKLRRSFEFIFLIEAKITRAWAKSAHKRLLISQWYMGKNPEWFDHNIDHYYAWVETGNSLWLERGAFSSMCLKQDGDVLELCCGDGFNASNFYSHRSNSVIAVDFDVSAIKSAKENWHRTNIKFEVADIRTQMPIGKYDNIIWDAAIEHFTEDEITKLMTDIKERMKSHTVLSGYTLVERDDGIKHIHQHEYEFQSKEDLMRFLKPHFANVVVFETIYPSRHNLYFWAADDETRIPFNCNWQSMSIAVKG